MSPQSSEPQKAQEKHDAESAIKRNPHGDFNKVQASRPDWDESREWQFTKTRNPDWTYGSGASDKSSIDKSHVSIDPYAEGRPPVSNYKLLISGIVPRPIGFLSTRSKDGSSTNLAPFSYTQVFNHDPPIFGVGFSGGLDNAKDTLRNLVDTDEVVINIISDHYIEAANACAIDLPYGQSEWVASGLTPAESKVVAPSRVKEAVFSIEGKLLNIQEFESRAQPGKKTGVLAIIEGVHFWVREDAINEEQSLIDPAILRPISRLGGITYARVTDGFELLRPVLKREQEDGRIKDELLKPKVDGQ
jgi:flavin reductase (DIM6/NTAB) family NADH-FMN oxidoreductase RutF